ncbi:MAG: electron transfer flavoprotein subunit alpha/FixB family protein [Methylophilaceae bacterium]
MTRIDPHRPEQQSPTGLKRVVLDTPLRPQEAHPPKPLRTPAKPKARMLFIAHSDRGAMDDHARQALAAAAILADTETAVVALILGELHEDLSTAGADEVMVLPELSFHKFQPDVELALVLATIASVKPVRIFIPDNLIGDGDLGRRLIAYSQLASATQVVEIDAQHVASEQTGGSVLAICGLPEIILLAPNAVETELPFSASAKRINAPAISQATSVYQDCGLQASAAADIALEEADFIVSAGNGVQNLTTLETLATALNASVGASRVVVDDGRLPRDKQIGATGKTVNASVYVAVGISGAVQHLQGIKDCRHVIAINRDSSAPIVKRADLSVIGDAEEIMQALIAEIAHAKASA